MKTIEVKIHEIAVDGLPDMDKLVNQVAFLWDGNVIYGWPLLTQDPQGSVWEGDSDFALPKMFGGVTHWVEFPTKIILLHKPQLLAKA